MAVNRQMFEAAFKVSRANPGVVLDTQRSNTYELLLVHPVRKKYWRITHDGKIKRVPASLG